jgi:hypothetical protein
MIFVAFFAMLASAAIVSTLDKGYVRRPGTAKRITPAEHARLAQFYAEQAQACRIQSQNQLEIDRFLSQHFRKRAARMQALELEHRMRAR